MIDINLLANTLHEAVKSAKATEQISLKHSITLAQAYEIQHKEIELRQEEGEKLIGVKMGFTSEAKMLQMGVKDMIIGQLTDRMLFANNDKITVGKFIHPRAEPEICFILSEDINGALTVDEVKQKVSGIAAAIEIIDSRYENFKFSLEDVVADNCSSAGFVIGQIMPIQTSLSDLKIDLMIDETIVESGSSNDILGDPWKALSAATRLAETYKIPLKKGMYVMAGAATSAHFVSGHLSVSAEIHVLGEVRLSLSN
jgi:2-oxo-3-hexenedioate decarboxylase